MYSVKDNEDITPTGLPHSDISGSMLFSSSPKLFAGIRVLHRLLMPRHPPAALNSLTKNICVKAVIIMSYLIQIFIRLTSKLRLAVLTLFLFEEDLLKRRFLSMTCENLLFQYLI